MHDLTDFSIHILSCGHFFSFSFIATICFFGCCFGGIIIFKKQKKMAKYIFVTGGVSSSLGKGIIAASLAKLLQARGLRVTIQKFDPYINVDPGTLNPYEHGECFVT